MTFGRYLVHLFSFGTYASNMAFRYLNFITINSRKQIFTVCHFNFQNVVLSNKLFNIYHNCTICLRFFLVLSGIYLIWTYISLQCFWILVWIFIQSLLLLVNCWNYSPLAYHNVWILLGVVFTQIISWIFNYIKLLIFKIFFNLAVAEVKFLNWLALKN